jgi:hypothetical protein
MYEFVPSRGLILGQVAGRLADRELGFRGGLAPAVAIGAKVAGAFPDEPITVASRIRPAAPQEDPVAVWEGRGRVGELRPFFCCPARPGLGPGRGQGYRCDFAPSGINGLGPPWRAPILPAQKFAWRPVAAPKSWSDFP